MARVRWVWNMSGSSWVVGAVALGVSGGVQGHQRSGQAEGSRRGERLWLADRHMRGAAGARGVHGPRQYSGPPGLRERLSHGHLVEEVATGVRHLLGVHEDRMGA